MVRYESEERLELMPEVVPPPRYERGDPIPQLTVQELIDFENAHPVNDGAKASLIASTLGMRPLHYMVQRNRLMDNPEALEADPILIHRLRKDRAERVLERTTHRPTPHK